MKEFESSNVYTGTIIKPGKKLAVMNIINILFQMELWMLNDPASVISGAIACGNHGQNQNYFSFFTFFLKSVIPTSKS